MNVRVRIKEIMEKKGVSANELGRGIGVSGDYVRKLLRGSRRLNLDHIEATARVLGVHVAVLFIDDALVAEWKENAHF